MNGREVDVATRSTFPIAIGNSTPDKIMTKSLHTIKTLIVEANTMNTSDHKPIAVFVKSTGKANQGKSVKL